VSKFLAACLFLALNFYTYYFLGREQIIPPRVNFALFPMQLGDWKCKQKERMTPETEKNLGATDYLICEFRSGSGLPPVGLYVGYHATQVREEGGGSGESMIHPPAHCLPGSGWDIIASEKMNLDLPGLPGRPARVNRLVIAKAEARQVVYYWYQERGTVIADDWQKIVELFWSRATRHRSDGSLVRFTVPLFRGREAEADTAFQELAAQAVPLLPAYVPN
jgi:EpsI family protein